MDEQCFVQRPTTGSRVAGVGITVLTLVSAGFMAWLAFDQLGGILAVGVALLALAFVAWTIVYVTSTPRLVVDEGGIRATYGLVFRRTIAPDAVVEVSEVHFRPLRDLGGWGVRKSDDLGRVLVSGVGEGVCIVDAEGTRTTVAVDQPADAAAALRAVVEAARPGG